MKTCKKCGSSGPFPKQGNLCKKCEAERKAIWFQAKQLAKNPGYVPRTKREDKGTRVRKIIGPKKPLSQESRNPYFRAYNKRTNHAVYLRHWRAARKGVFCADCGARLNDQTCWCIYQQ